MDRAPYIDTEQLRSFGHSGEQVEDAFALVYARLRRMAAASLRRGGPATLQPTVLVNDAWLRIRPQLPGLRSREHFFALAALAMRHILADYARSQRVQRRDEQRVTVALELVMQRETTGLLDVVALDDALSKLRELKMRHARVVELRFLCSLSIRETASVLGVSPGTVEADWAMARTWLREELARD